MPVINTAATPVATTPATNGASLFNSLLNPNQSASGPNINGLQNLAAGSLYGLENTGAQGLQAATAGQNQAIQLLMQAFGLGGGTAVPAGATPSTAAVKVGPGQSGFTAKQTANANGAAATAAQPGYVDPNSPYALSAPQQQTLNQQVDRINTQKQVATKNAEAQFAASGISDPAVRASVTQQINQYYDSQTNQAITTAQLQAQQEKIAGATALESFYNNLASASTGQIENSASGQANLAGQETQANLQQEQINAQEQASTFGFLGSLLGAIPGLAGLFSSPGSLANSTGVNNGYGQYGPPAP